MSRQTKYHIEFKLFLTKRNIRSADISVLLIIIFELQKYRIVNFRQDDIAPCNLEANN